MAKNALKDNKNNPNVPYQKSTIRDLLLTTKDGDWGKDLPKNGFIAYRVIRGGDFDSVRFGDISEVPRCYLNEKTVWRRTLQDKDILIETAGGTREKPTGRTLLINQRVLDRFDLPVTCASFARFMRVDPEKAVPEYVYWFLQAMYAAGEMWQHQVQHTGVARFQFTAFSESVEIPLPPLEYQRAITHILGTLDDKIELNRRMNETLEAMARAIFKSWFVDFDPVRAKMSSESPESICNRLGLTPDLLDLFPDRLQDSELGEIPEGWIVLPVGDAIQRLPVGKKYNQKTVGTKGKVPVLDQGKSGIIGYHDDEPGVVATTENPIVVFANHTCYMRLIPYSFSAIQNVLPFAGSGLNTVWVFYATYGKQNFIEYKGHWPDFVIHKIAVPDTKLADKFTEYVNPMLKMVWAQENESMTLAESRDTLLPKLLSGKLPLLAAGEA